MSRRKKHQEESFETADGFQIEDMEGNAVVDDALLDDMLPDEAVKADALLEDEHNPFWDDEDEDDEKEEDEYFNSVAENSNWEEGYDY
ncbi:MAG TPA: hypothetical protein PK031_04520 [Pseudomonadales bacterium]|nr:hypothetical protein [Pseudomonadales bacterium]